MNTAFRTFVMSALNGMPKIIAAQTPPRPMKILAGEVVMHLLEEIPHLMVDNYFVTS